MATKQEIQKFLDSNPPEIEKADFWEKHLKQTGYQRGMPLMCSCGCYQFAWGTVPEGVEVWYLPGHEPKSTEKTKQESPDREGEEWWVKPIANAVVLFLGLLAIYLVWSIQFIPR